MGMHLKAGTLTLSSDERKAMQLFEQSAEKGHGKSQLALARMLGKEKGKAMLKKAFESTDPFVQGSFYHLGLEVNHTFQRDEVKAAKYFTKAMQEGDAEGCRMLGLCFELGNSICSRYSLYILSIFSQYSLNILSIFSQQVRVSKKMWKMRRNVISKRCP